MFSEQREKATWIGYPSTGETGALGLLKAENTGDVAVKVERKEQKHKRTKDEAMLLSCSHFRTPATI